MDAFTRFLVENKWWWLTPILLVAALVVALVVAGDPDPTDPDAATPFTYDVR